jgi:hypothetical protein
MNAAKIVAFLIAVPNALYAVVALFGNFINASQLPAERLVLGVGLSMIVLMLFAIFLLLAGRKSTS